MRSQREYLLRASMRPALKALRAAFGGELVEIDESHLKEVDPAELAKRAARAIDLPLEMIQGLRGNGKFKETKWILVWFLVNYAKLSFAKAATYAGYTSADIARKSQDKLQDRLDTDEEFRLYFKDIVKKVPEGWRTIAAARQHDRLKNISNKNK